MSDEGGQRAWVECGTWLIEADIYLNLLAVAFDELIELEQQ
jgi:hypothetical protein